MYYVMLLFFLTGQFYSVVCTANLNIAMPERVKTVLYLTFFDEPDKRMEANHWQYWYNLQANPNQKAFDIGRQKIIVRVFFASPFMYYLAAHLARS